MNKKLLLGMLAGATFIFTGCQDEAILATTDGESQVTFTAEIPQGIATRAFADGTTATQLTYAVYETGSTTKLIDGTAEFNGLKTTVNLRLVNGKTYDILFWAQDPDATCYTFDMATQTVTVDYAGIKSSDETRDAFFKAQTFAVSGTINETVQLYRPFSQLNIGATDYQEATQTGFTTTQTKVVVNHLANKINLLSGAVEGDETITYDLANVPADGETFPVKGVNADYLAMNYLLVPQDKQLVDVDFTATNGSHNIARHYSNVPVQRNYRTNIYGNILTEEANFNVEIVPAFLGDHAYPTVGYIQNGDTYEIFAPEGLQWLAKQVNSNVTFAGKTVVLTGDIDMAGKAFTPIGNLLSYPSTTFAGTFDGQNHTIYNLTTADYTPNHAVAGLFGSTTGTIKNVTLKNVNIRSSHYAGAIVAYSSVANVVVENCHVDGGTVTSKAELLSGSYDNGDKVGGIAGYIVSGDQINGCTIKNLTVQGYRDLGGIVGYAAGTVQNCTVGENVTIIVDNENNYKNYTQPEQYNANSIIGRRESSTTDTNNNGEATIVRPAAVATVATAEELKNILNTFGAAGAGSNVVEITNDIVLADGESWTPVVVNGYQGAEKIIINGNNHTIKGLNAPLFSGGFAGHSGIIIRDLTIIDSNMTTSNTIGAGCFIESIDSMEKIELTNCHVKNTTLTSTCGSRVGGLIGWTAGYNNPNDGPVDTYVTISNCSVIDCTIESNGSVGGIYGHAGNNPATYSTVENCTVTGCHLISTDDGGWRVGVVVGTANVGEMTINNITESGNTLEQTGQTAPAHSNLYGRFVPDTTGKLYIDGVQITE
ncbi:MAG: DUF6562 domain-containing protein [Candidatus Limisoma sp.]